MFGNYKIGGYGKLTWLSQQVSKSYAYVIHLKLLLRMFNWIKIAFLMHVLCQTLVGLS